MDIVQQLVGTPLWPSAHAIARTGRHAAELVPRPDVPPPERPGASRFGGVPDLPAGVRWPRARGRPLSLLLQLDLADLDGIEGTDVLPDEGVLSFFYDIVDQPWGDRRSDRTGWRVLYSPEGVDLLRSHRRSGVTSEIVLPAVALTSQHAITFPSPLSGLAPIEDDDDLVYRDLVLGGVRTRHLLLGHPDPIQNDPVPWGSLSLLQLDSDPLLRMAWGNRGKLHWTIRDAALSDRRFEATRLELQCC